jgi:hypothetical protein
MGLWDTSAIHSNNIARTERSSSNFNLQPNEEREHEAVSKIPTLDMYIDQQQSINLQPGYVSFMYQAQQQQARLLAQTNHTICPFGQERPSNFI